MVTQGASQPKTAVSGPDSQSQQREQAQASDIRTAVEEAVKQTAGRWGSQGWPELRDSPQPFVDETCRREA